MIDQVRSQEFEVKIPIRDKSLWTKKKNERNCLEENTNRDFLSANKNFEIPQNNGANPIKPKPIKNTTFLLNFNMIFNSK